MKIGKLFDVSGLVTVVTGAASGIGFAYAEAMADNGAQVILTDRELVTLEAAVDKLRKAGGKVSGELLDVTNRPQMQEVFDRIVSDFGRLDVVFANAGIDAGPGFMTPVGERCEEGAIENLSYEFWDKVISVDLTGVFSTIKVAAKHMKRQRNGRIIVTTSIASLYNEPIVGTAYMPAKAGAAHLVRQVALELAEYNVLVNAIAPGPFSTNIADGRLKDPRDRKAFEDMSPVHRIASTDEIQGIAVFLASPAASYVTGAEMVIDGGVVLGRL